MTYSFLESNIVVGKMAGWDWIGETKVDGLFIGTGIELGERTDSLLLSQQGMFACGVEGCLDAWQTQPLKLRRDRACR